MNAPPAPREFATATEAWINLKRNVTAQKVQASREKIASDIYAITRWKTNDFSFPVPAEHQEAYFVKLEGNGIWRRVFGYLTHLPDITNASLACELFREHLEKQRDSMLLQQVFGVLRKHDKLYPGAQRRKSSLSKGDVLNLRLVSKTWKASTEDQFLTPEGFAEPDWHLQKDVRFNVMNNFSLFPAEFRKPKDVERALSVLRTSTSCAALLKNVVICLNVRPMPLLPLSAAEVAGFYDLLGRLLEIHGKHVWSLHYGGLFDYKCLRNLVSRMPNLKELCINASINPSELNEEDDGIMLALFPFPCIPSLRRLTFAEIPKHMPWTAEIIQRNPSLKTVSISEDATERLPEFLPVLENLRLECFDFGIMNNESIQLPDIQSLRRMQWPLKVLNLTRADQHAFVNEADEVNANELLEIINHFSGTLEEIKLDSIVLRGDGSRSRSVMVVDFPNLKNVVFYPGVNLVMQL